MSIILWPLKFLLKLIFKVFIGIFSSAILGIIAILSIGLIAQNSPDPKVANSGKRLVNQHAVALFKRVTIVLAVTAYGSEAYAEYSEVDSKEHKTNSEVAGEVAGKVAEKEINELFKLIEDIFSDIYLSFSYIKILVERLIYENS